MNARALLHAGYELAPIFIFFIAGQLVPFLTAVWIFVVATAVSLVLGWTVSRHIPIMPLASALLSIGAGILTVYFNQPNAIILADTIWYWGLAIVVAVGFFTPKHFFEYMFDEAFAMQRVGWVKHARRWFVMLIIAGAANEYIRIMMTPEFWIDYRFTKVILLTIFGFYQFSLARKYRIKGESNQWGFRIAPVKL